MSPVAISALLLVLPAAALGWMLWRRAASWAYQVHLARSLWLAHFLEVPLSPFDLREVVLSDPYLPEGSTTIALTVTGGGSGPCLLRLDAPLGDRSAAASRWWREMTPLLLASDPQGESVLHGPDGRLVGRVVAWTDHRQLGVLTSDE